MCKKIDVEMIKIREINNEKIFDIILYEYEEELKVICDCLSKQYKLQILDKIEGPGTTIWKLNINGQKVSLVNNSYSNYFKPEDESAKTFFERELPTISSILGEK